MSTVEEFHFGAARVRVVEIGDEPWFVLADIALVLGITAPARLAARLDEGMRQTHPLATGGGVQQMTVVSEAGMYEVVIRSDKPGAAAFRAWITGEVLPQIRRTGTYGVAQLDPTSPDGMRLVLQAATAALAELEVAKPKAEAWDELAAADGDYSVGDAAKILARAGIDIGQTRLFATLAELGWAFRRSGRWQAAQRYVDRGFLAHRAQSHRHPDTDAVVIDAPQLRVTPNGVRALRDRLRASEPLPALTG